MKMAQICHQKAFQNQTSHNAPVNYNHVPHTYGEGWESPG